MGIHTISTDYHRLVPYCDRVALVVKSHCATSESGEGDENATGFAEMARMLLELTEYLQKNI